MRKLLLTAALASAVAFANAQTMTSKNGTPILPEANDWSIGFDAHPLISYFGNLFNNSAGNNAFMNYPSNNSMLIVGKMVKDESTAYRAKVGINFGSTKVTRSTLGFTSLDSVSSASEVKKSYMNITLGAGIQKWRGKGRLKGYYGAEAMIGFGSDTTTKNTFLKALSTTDGVGTSQTSEFKGGSMFGFGLQGFIGVEYFFAPKMSLSAEYTWGLALSSTGATETSYQIVENPSGTTVVSSKTDVTGDKTSNFNIGVGNTVTPNVLNHISTGSGSIVLSMYF
jgi:hypothetical protein